MKSASLTKIKADFDSYLKTCGQEPLLVTKNGRPIAALVAVVDPDEIERLRLASSVKLDALFSKALQRIQTGEGLSHDEVLAQVEALPNIPTRKSGQRTRGRNVKRVVRVS